MPIYRYGCQDCLEEREEIQAIDAPAPECCEAPMVKMMPRRVRGRVVGSEQQVRHAQAEQAEARADGLRIRSGGTGGGKRDAQGFDPLAGASWSGPATSKAEQTSRLRDGREAFTEWQARSLQADGVPRGEALRKASKHQQQVAAIADAQDQP